MPQAHFALRHQVGALGRYRIPAVPEGTYPMLVLRAEEKLVRLGKAGDLRGREARVLRIVHREMGGHQVEAEAGGGDRVRSEGVGPRAQEFEGGLGGVLEFLEALDREWVT